MYVSGTHVSLLFPLTCIFPLAKEFHNLRGGFGALAAPRLRTNAQGLGAVIEGEAVLLPA